jgi:hypothetical protein
MVHPTKLLQQAYLSLLSVFVPRSSTKLWKTIPPTNVEMLYGLQIHRINLME